ncbi:MAG: hypothetical protein HFJ81_07285 [Clostridia bacterium]|nr:hypothetical protein [Clostridia bacterium]
MEEENKDFEAREGKAEQPTREDILAASRNENKNGDEREKQSFAKAGTLAFSTGLVIAGIILIVTAIRGDRFPVEIMLIVCGMQAVQNIVVAVSNRKLMRLYLILGTVQAIIAVIFLVFWILQLCGVLGAKF